MEERQEYKRLKRLIHTAPVIDNPKLLEAIQQFEASCTDKKLAKSLHRKYKWHRIYHPEKQPLGQPPQEWSDRQQPMVSVIIPNYCHAPYLKERIDSVLNQTFQNFELILLDDCSTDNSRDILLSYKSHPKVSHVVLNEQNTGSTFLQWDKGVSLANGKYIWIAESDDFADETFLGNMMGVFYLHPECVIARSGSYHVNQHGRVMVKDLDLWKEDYSVNCYQGDDYIRHNMLHLNYIYNASMVVFRKDVFQRIDKGYQQLHYTGDWLCWVEFLKEGVIGEYRRKLNYFRQHEQKVTAQSQKSNKGLADQICVMEYILHNFKLSPMRRLMIRGEHYRLVKKTFRYEEEKETAQECFEALKNRIHATYIDYALYQFIRLFSFLPLVHTTKNDKYK